MLQLIVFFVSLAILYLLLQGAPYVPAKAKGIDQAFMMMKLPAGSTVVDLGCGDGRVLITAARRGYKAVGIEIHPLFWLIAWIRTRRYGKQVKVVYGNLWRWNLPEATTGIFVFSADAFTTKLEAWLDAQRLRSARPFQLVTFGAELPSRKGRAGEWGCTLYSYESVTTSK